MHIQDTRRCNWLRERLETSSKREPDAAERRQLLDRLAWSEHFETFSSQKFVAAKRFGLEGAETLIPGLKAMIDELADRGAESIVLGMPHRGRLNVLANVVRKPLRQIFAEFAGEDMTGDAATEGFATGDVKYHLGTSFDRPTTGRTGRRVHLSLLANPSHLETVNTVVLGKTRAKQFYLGDTPLPVPADATATDRDVEGADGDGGQIDARGRVVPVLLHGDGAFSGQGVVYETLDISALPEYDVGGVIHVVVNNQVAFTTDAKQWRAGAPYASCTDVARGLGCPVLHVNGDDCEAVADAFRLAAAWRQTWRSDVVIDLVCYRKHGHNEIDEPTFTHPSMYALIKNKQNPFEIYRDSLVERGLISRAEADEASARVLRLLGEEHAASRSYVPTPRDWLSSYWHGFKGPGQHALIRNTGVPMDVLRSVGDATTRLPGAPSNSGCHSPELDAAVPGFRPHRGVLKLYETRRAALEPGREAEPLLDWGAAEALAFATLLNEGFHVRLSGQDVERGTFSHRHAVLHDQAPAAERGGPLPFGAPGTGHDGDGDGLADDVAPGSDLARLVDPRGNGLSLRPRRFAPLDAALPGGPPGHFTVTNSTLSEYGILGYDLGYSLENPNALVMWEAQFGDFANGAQIMFDQFLSSGEAKWLRQCGLVCLLPHGYDGQGPEHSSCRLERFLQMCQEDPYAIPEAARKLARGGGKGDDALEKQWFAGGHLGGQIQASNWQIANVTTPANYFHLLRRQVHREFRKPLILASPKALLRHPACRSSLSELDDVADDAGVEGVRFRRLIMDEAETDRSPHPPTRPDVRRLIFCSGKVYYDLAAGRAERGLASDVALCRIEQLSPFPFDLVMREIRRYPNARVGWAQEEPQNMGAYHHCVPRINTCLREEGRMEAQGSGCRLPFWGRRSTASPSTGYLAVHQVEQAALVEAALDLDGNDGLGPGA